MPAPSTVVYAIESTLLVAGFICLWRFFLSPSARARALQPSPLPLWEIDGYVYGLSVLRVLGVTFAVWSITPTLLEKLAPDLSRKEGLGLILIGCSLQIGFLLGLALAAWLARSARFQARLNAHLTAPAQPLRPPLATKHIPLAGLITFAIIIALVGPLSLLWPTLLKWLHLPVKSQEAVELFGQLKTPAEMGVMLVFAAIIAPITEELLFRMGIFRYTRGRLPRALAVGLPALLFALAHPSLVAMLPLFVFAVIQSLAYERTGRIAVPMIAHGLFNLHTAGFILLGADPYNAFGNWLSQ